MATCCCSFCKIKLSSAIFSHLHYQNGNPLTGEAGRRCLLGPHKANHKAQGEAHCGSRLLHRRKPHKPSLCCDRASNVNWCDKRNNVHSSFKEHLYVLVLLFLVGLIGNKTLPTGGSPKTTGWPHALGGSNWLGTAGVPSPQQSHGLPPVVVSTVHFANHCENKLQTCCLATAKTNNGSKPFQRMSPGTEDIV